MAVKKVVKTEGTYHLTPLEHWMLPAEKWKEADLLVFKKMVHVLEVYIGYFCTMIQVDTLDEFVIPYVHFFTLYMRFSATRHHMSFRRR